MMQSLFSEQKRLIDDFFHRVDVKAAEKMLEAFYHCQGTIYFSGVGKSALIAQKITQMLISIGTKAGFLNPVDAQHGDLGVVRKEDLFVMLSKSGESKELIDLIPYLRQREVQLLSWVCKKGSKLARFSDQSIYLPLEKELCMFDLAPTTSSALQLIFGDVLIVGLMQKRGFSLDDYALNHPAGLIGKKLTLKVKDVMFKEEKIPFVNAKELLIHCLETLTKGASGCVVVVDDLGLLQGIFTDGDLRRALMHKGAGILQASISSLMSKNPKTIDPETLATNALEIMQENDHLVHQLPVITEEKIVGLVRLHDLVKEGLA